MPRPSLMEWLEERRDNYIRIAQGKSGDDLRRCIEDLDYFDRAIRCAEHCERELRSDKLRVSADA